MGSAIHHSRIRADGGPLREAPVALDALRSLPGGAVLVFDRDLRFVLASGGAITKHGYTPEDLEGRFCAEVVPLERWARYEPLYVAALSGEESAVELDSIDGAARFMVDIGPLRDDHGDVIGGVAVSRDVTAVRRLEAEVRLRQELAGHLASVVDSSADAIISKTPDGTIVSWNRGAARFSLSLDVMAIADDAGHFVRVNPAFQDTLGYSLQDLTDKPFAEFVHPEDLDSTLQLYAELLAGTPAIAFENRYLCKDGTFRLLLWNAQACARGACLSAIAAWCCQGVAPGLQVRAAEARRVPPTGRRG